MQALASRSFLLSNYNSQVVKLTSSNSYSQGEVTMSLGEYILRHVDSMNFGNINFNYQHIMILLTTINLNFSIRSCQWISLFVWWQLRRHMDEAGSCLSITTMQLLRQGWGRNLWHRFELNMFELLNSWKIASLVLQVVAGVVCHSTCMVQDSLSPW